MANPNIAAISELHVGTLGFNLKTNGATFVTPRILENTTTTSWDHPTATSIYGYTLSDTFIMNAQAYDSGRSTTSMSYNSDAMTLVYDEVEFQTDSSGSGALGYKVNPDIGNYDMSVSMGGSGNFANISSFWGNVDQTTPLKTFYVTIINLLIITMVLVIYTKLLVVIQTPTEDILSKVLKYGWQI